MTCVVLGRAANELQLKTKNKKQKKNNSKLHLNLGLSQMVEWRASNLRMNRCERKGKKQNKKIKEKGQGKPFTLDSFGLLFRAPLHVYK